MLVVQQATIAIDALEGIVGCRILLVTVETEVVLVGLFVLELVNVSSDDDTDVWERGRGIRWDFYWR